MTDLGPARTIRQARWDEAYRGVEYLNRIWARATARGQAEVTLKVPTGFVWTLAEAVLHMANHAMPLYRTQRDVEERLLGMVGEAALAHETLYGAAQRVALAVSELEALVERRRTRYRVVLPRVPSTVFMPFGC